MKIQLARNKGTQIQVMEVGVPNWSGELFKTLQEEQMASLPKAP